MASDNSAGLRRRCFRRTAPVTLGFGIAFVASYPDGGLGALTETSATVIRER
jgi:hypothetical protein